MCLTPIYIKNPTYSRSSYVSQFGACTKIPSYLQPSTQYIEVPCGKCADCRSVYFNSLLQRSIVESLSSYMFFVTLTYDNDHLPCLVLPTGDTIYYYDYSDVQNLFKRFRDSGSLDRDFRYLAVNEYGDHTHRPHAHLLLFLSKKEDDTPVTPYELERLLFDNIRKYYAVNVGTRKNPIYEPLFTYRERYTSKGLTANYFVKYVAPQSTGDVINVLESSSFVRTICYLIGYVNKGSRFDSYVSNLLDKISDVTLVKKLKHILASKVRYSKGFGCGFHNGKKIYLPRIMVKASSNTLVYTDIVKNMPNTFEEFCDLYPTLSNDLIEYVDRDIYRLYDTLEHCFQHMSSDDYFMHCLMLKYYPCHFSTIYNSYYREHPLKEPKISYYFTRPTQYKKPTIITSSTIEDSLTFRYLRVGVNEGIISGVPFLAFKTFEGFTALCRFYKERVTTIDDLQLLYKRLNVSNYEEWKALFVKQLNLKKANKSQANVFIYSNNDKITFNSQKKYLNLPKLISGVELYTTLFTDCNRRK